MKMMQAFQTNMDAQIEAMSRRTTKSERPDRVQRRKQRIMHHLRKSLTKTWTSGPRKSARRSQDKRSGPRRSRSRLRTKVAKGTSKMCPRAKQRPKFEKTLHHRCCVLLLVSSPLGVIVDIALSTFVLFFCCGVPCDSMSMSVAVDASNCITCANNRHHGLREAWHAPALADTLWRTTVTGKQSCTRLMCAPPDVIYRVNVRLNARGLTLNVTLLNTVMS